MDILNQISSLTLLGRQYGYLRFKKKHNSLDQLGKYPCSVCNFLKDNPGFSFVPDRNLNFQCAPKISSNSDWCQWSSCLGFFFFKCMYIQGTKPIYLSPNEVFSFLKIYWQADWQTSIGIHQHNHHRQYSNHFPTL